MINLNTIPWLLRIEAWLLVSVLFGLMLMFIWIGSMTGQRRRKERPDYHDNPSNNTIYGSVFGLLAFLLAFTFSMSGNRFDARRLASIKESNDISTAILRADLYPDSDRVVLRNYFKLYLQARIDFLTAGTDLKKVVEAWNGAKLQSDHLWRHVSDFYRRNNTTVITGQMVPALNNMFDSANSNKYSELMHVPASIVSMLFILTLVASFYAGYVSVGKGRFDWFIAVGFCLLISVVIYITLDLDRPRRGLIQMDTSHEAIIEIMQQFEKDP